MTVEAIPCAACKWWSNEPVIGEDGRTWGRCKVTGCMTDADFWCKKGGTEENLYTSDQIQEKAAGKLFCPPQTKFTAG